MDIKEDIPDQGEGKGRAMRMVGEDNQNQASTSAINKEDLDGADDKENNNNTLNDELADSKVLDLKVCITAKKRVADKMAQLPFIVLGRPDIKKIVKE